LSHTRDNFAGLPFIKKIHGESLQLLINFDTNFHDHALSHIAHVEVFAIHGQTMQHQQGKPLNHADNKITGITLSDVSIKIFDQGHEQNLGTYKHKETKEGQAKARPIMPNQFAKGKN
jgi:hypothetical protein